MTKSLPKSDSRPSSPAVKAARARVEAEVAAELEEKAKLEAEALKVAVREQARTGEELLQRRQMRVLAACTHSLAAQRERESAAGRAEEETRLKVQRMLADALQDCSEHAAAAVQAQDERDQALARCEEAEQMLGEQRERLQNLTAFRDRAEAMEAKVRHTAAAQYQLQTGVDESRAAAEMARAERAEALASAAKAHEELHSLEAANRELVHEKGRSEQAAAAAAEQLVMLLKRVDVVEETTPQRAHVADLEKRCRDVSGEARVEARAHHQAERGRDEALTRMREAEQQIAELWQQLQAAEEAAAAADGQRSAAEGSSRRLEGQLHDARLSQLEIEQRATSLEAALRSLQTTNVQLAHGLNTERAEKAAAVANARAIEDPAAGAFSAAARARTAGQALAPNAALTGITPSAASAEVPAGIAVEHRQVAYGITAGALRSVDMSLLSPGM